MKKILMIIFSTICIISISFLSSCEKDNLPYKEEGYFKYYYTDNTAYVVGLTELGMQQEVLDFTVKLDGKEIVLGYKHRINYSTVLEEYNFESEILKKIYIQEDNIHFVPFDFIFENVDLKKTIFLSDYAAIAVINDTYIPVYLCSYVVYDEKKYDINKYHQFYANVEYNLNYDNNDIYFIDDYDNELISYIPQEPEREGYTFDGWYKESECINRWDFSNDIIKEKKWLNDKKEYYKDQDYEKTTLYAKWI